jgi:exodeoxyribonuclease VII small subunit
MTPTTADATTAPEPDDLSYEQARDELVDIVRRLESGGGPLEESLRLWERGERLAARCEQWLTGAQERMDALLTARSGGANADRDGSGDEGPDADAADDSGVTGNGGPG